MCSGSDLLRGGRIRRLGMDGHAGDLRKLFADAIFERGGHVVDYGDGQIAVHGAVAGNENLALDLAHAHFVAVGQLMKFLLQIVHEIFDVARQIAHLDNGLRARDMRSQRLDVNIDYGVLRTGVRAERREVTNLLFQFGGASVRLAQAELLVHLQVQLDERRASSWCAESS